jgi:cobalt-zinc-cadmium efflux system membrane fusion protein
MMKKLLLLALFSYTLEAKELTLSQKEIATWGIKEAKVQKSEQVPLGSFIVEVTTPPTLIQTISLPFEAQVVSLDVALYQRVKKGDLLAQVSGTEWISAQKSAISDAIELRHHSHTAERKNRLCKEEIIPKKECIAANAELRTDRIKVAASKALLKSYGASEKMIDTLFNNLKIFASIPITAPTDGTIIELNAYPGKSTAPSSALFVIQKEGAFWLESDLPLIKTEMLKEGETVLLRIEGKTYKSKVLQIAPTLNQQNQTRHIRFSLPPKSGLLPGLRTNATLLLQKEAYKVPKKAVIKYEGDHIVFIKDGNKFQNIIVTILGEDNKYYYLKPDSRLSVPLVVSAVAVLKNMLGEGDE